MTSLFALLLNSKFDLICHCFGSVAELKENADRALTSALGILDINLGHGAPTGVDALLWLQEREFPGKVIMLTGHSQSNSLVKQARTLGVLVYEKPLKTEVLLEIIAAAFNGDNKCEISSK